MEHVETLIIGAGPAGAAAAHSLASAGHDVLLADKATFPRDKICGDGLTTLCLRELEQLGFRVGKLESFKAVGGAQMRGPNGRHLDIGLPDGPGVYAGIVRREEFDHELVKYAADAGADTKFGAKAIAASPAGDHIDVDFDDGATIRARQCVAADGVYSPMRKLLGLGIDGYRGEWHAFRQYFVNVAPAAASELWIWFEPDLLPGYMWSFPLGDGAANVGFGILRGGSITTQEMGALWPDLLARDHIREVLGADAQPEGSHRAWPIPARVDGVPLTGPRTLFVGDAAAACDTLTGEGIGQALLTGRLAAEAILESPNANAAAARYSNDVERELFADHKMASILGRMMSTRRVAEFALAAVDTNDWTRRNFGRWMFEDYPRAVVATPRRWSRKVFTGPGATV